MRRARGFTLVESMVTISCLGLASAGAYHLAFTVRQQLRIGEVDLALTRDAALVEHAWRRDVRSARTLTPADGALAVFDAGAASEVRWAVADGALVRRDARGELLLAPRVTGAALKREGGLVSLELSLQAPVGDLLRQQVVHAVAGAPEVVR